MPEHRIRLRGAWDWHAREGEIEVVRRLDLPTDWPVGVVSPFRLIRRFGRPPFDPSAESARLEFVGVPGLVAARLNGQVLAGLPAGAADWSVRLSGPLLTRNALVLEVDLGPGPPPEGPWGSIALVIFPRHGESV